MTRLTSRAVTDAPCGCGFLARSAAIPDWPIRHDQELDEYYFEYPTRDGCIAKVMIYHCPMCGGVASRSLRYERFEQVSDAEVARLRALIGDISTGADVQRILGKPDADEVFMPIGTGLLKPGTNELEEGPIRAVTYVRLSESADVQFLIFSNQRVQSSIVSKPRRPS